jgi:hypothetical protein
MAARTSYLKKPMGFKDGYAEYYQPTLPLDNDPPASHNGIRQINVLDWLLG